MDEFSDIFGKRLRNLMDEHDLTQIQLAEQLEYLTNSALSLYVLNKRLPRIDSAIDIAKYFDVSLDYLFGLSDVKKPINQAIVNMPVLKSYYNGKNNYDESNISEYLPIAKAKFKDANNLFGFTIKSQLMRPRFYEGDLTIVERTKDVKTGDIILVAIGNDDAIIRELTTTNGGWVLNPFSPVQPPTFYSWDDMEKQNVRLIGKVIESLVKY